MYAVEFETTVGADGQITIPPQFAHVVNKRARVIMLLDETPAVNPEHAQIAEQADADARLPTSWPGALGHLPASAEEAPDCVMVRSGQVANGFEGEPSELNVSQVTEVVYRLEKRPKYNAKELAHYQAHSPEICMLFGRAEQIWGKPLTYDDMSMLFAFYDYDRLPVMVIEKMLVHCADMGKYKRSYLEKVAQDWSENEIDTPEKADAYVSQYSTYYTILKAMGITNHTPTAANIKYMQRWLQTYAHTLDMVLEACNLASEAIGKPTFAYVESILKDWHQKGVRTIADTAAARADFEAKRNRAPAAKKPTTPGRFHNFKQREWDYTAIEAMQQKF